MIVTPVTGVGADYETTALLVAALAETLLGAFGVAADADVSNATSDAAVNVADTSKSDATRCRFVCQRRVIRNPSKSWVIFSSAVCAVSDNCATTMHNF